MSQLLENVGYIKIFLGEGNEKEVCEVQVRILRRKLKIFSLIDSEVLSRLIVMTHKKEDILVSQSFEKTHIIYVHSLKIVQQLLSRNVTIQQYKNISFNPNCSRLWTMLQMVLIIKRLQSSNKFSDQLWWGNGESNVSC